MIAILQSLERTESLAAQCDALAAYLGLSAPVSEAVLRRARTDDSFASMLVLSRPYPDLLQRLLNAAAADRRYEAAEQPKALTTSRALRKAASSLLAWAKSGFANVDDHTYQERLDTCRNCPHLVAPPELTVYKLKLDSETDMRICNRCGCVARRKARLASERCPDGRWLLPKKEAER